MKRKTFLKRTLPLAAMPFMIKGLSVSTFGKGCFFKSALTNSREKDRVLVLVQLQGGNDGLNTVIPLDQYPNLIKARKNILIPDKQVLKLNNSSAVGLHPALGELQSLYNNKEMTIIQGVGYANPSLSHFRASDIWLTGSDSKTVLSNGWIGRFLDYKYPNYPNGYPNSAAPDPPAIQIGPVLSLAFHGRSEGLSMAINERLSFYDLVPANLDSTATTPAGQLLSFIEMTNRETLEYTKVVKAAAKAQQNLSTIYPPPGNNALADQLKIVAKLIGGGLKTKVYMVNMDEFDTHGGQVDSSNPADGKHSDLLSKLSRAISAFQDDLHLMGKQDNVIGMVFSEFGRRIKSNASYGTDHGTSAPVLLFGTKLKARLIGTNPEIPSTVTVDDNVAMQHDFRSIYASVLKGWFGMSDSEMMAVSLGGYPILDLFHSQPKGHNA